MTLKQSIRGAAVRQSEIRAMTIACNKVGGINMAQGICDLEAPAVVIDGAKKAMDSGFNIYTPCEGLPVLREAVARHMKRFYGMEVDPDSEVLISIGATGALYATALVLLDPGDEVIVLEPFYGYHTAMVSAMGCVAKFVRMDPPDWALEIDRLEAAVTGKTRALIFNTPSNPAGKVFSRKELEQIADFAEAHDLVIFSDEIYEHFVYDGLKHLPVAMVPGLRERTITVSGLSKIFSITGWRLGYAICPPEVTYCASQLNDLVYVCAPAPLQVGAAVGMRALATAYYRTVAKEHEQKRDQFCAALRDAGLSPYVPQGAYYVLADISGVPGADDKERVMHILDKTGVASVPGRAFYHDDSGRDLTRFCFAKKQHVLDEACERIRKLRRG